MTRRLRALVLAGIEAGTNAALVEVATGRRFTAREMGEIAAEEFRLLVYVLALSRRCEEATT
jgi:hypothetical protein